MEVNEVEPPQNADLLDPLLTTATCKQCKCQIKPGEYRVVIVAAEVGRVPRRIDSSRIGGRRRILAFCARCAFGIIEGRDGEGETCFRNPLVRVLFGSTRKQISDDIAFDEQILREMAEEAKLMDAERQAREEELIAAVRCGDGNAVDAPQPQATPSKKDDRLLVGEYLRSPETHTLKLFQRRAGELYSQGKTQTEIERALGRDQTTVSRTLRDLKAKAYVWAQQEEKSKAAGAEKQLNQMFPIYPPYKDVMAHASTAGTSIERSDGDNRRTNGGRVKPRGAGPDADAPILDKPVDPRSFHTGRDA